jgi:alkaline phosphatase
MSCKQEPLPDSPKPLNIILLIGDGMGLSQLSAAYYYQDSTPVFSQFTQIGLLNTSSATHRITDSGAGGTALACGKRTYNGAIGLGPDSLVLENLTEYFSARKYKTGIVVSSSITHATPASFYAHVKHREMHAEIASQLLNSHVDFFAGGGLKYFTQRSDGQNLFNQFLGKGFFMDSLSLTFKGAVDPGKKYGFLLSPGHLPKVYEGRGSFLPDATQMSIEYLSRHSKGFFLMVEGSQIDWGGHDNDTRYLVEEVLDFEKSVAVAMEFARKNKNTLVIVTADHETGGFTLSADGEYAVDKGDYDQIAPTFSTPGHSAALVPVLSYGPYAETFGGIYNNNDLFAKMIKAAGY